MDKNKLLRFTATPLTIFGSFVVLISGVFMFFKIKNHTLEEIHSQVGILFVIAVVLHIILNWRPFANYFKKGQSYFLILPILALVANVLISEGGGKKPGVSPGMIFNKIENSSVLTVSQLFKTEPVKVLEKMKDSGLHVDSADQTLKEIAESNHKNPKEILGIFVESGTDTNPNK